MDKKGSVYIGRYCFRKDDECPLNITVLDFLYNFTAPDLEITWPCEARFYWLSLQPFVKFVRSLLGYGTPFIIIVGKSQSFQFIQ